MRRRVGNGSRSHEAIVDFRMILRTPLVVVAVNLSIVFSTCGGSGKSVTVIICEEIRADEGDLVSEELRKRATQCIQRSVIRQWLGFLAGKNFALPIVRSVSV